MSTKPYSQDLREKVINFIQSGQTQQSACKLFNLNHSTINRWWLRLKKEGHFNARKRKGSLPSIDKDKLIEEVENNPNSKTTDLAKKFGLSTTGIYYWLKKLGFVYKKKPSPMWKRIGQNN